MLLANQMHVVCFLALSSVNPDATRNCSKRRFQRSQSSRFLKSNCKCVKNLYIVIKLLGNGPSTTTEFLPLAMSDALGFGVLVLLRDRGRDVHLAYYTFSPLPIS